MDVFFLGAGKSFSGQLPSALKSISKNRKALDWQLQSLQRIDAGKINFIGGYHVDEVVEQYPELNYTIVPDWQSNNIIHTLLKAPFRKGKDALLLYSDTLFRPKTIEQFSHIKADVVVGVDSRWLTRFANRSDDDIKTSEVIDLSQLSDQTFDSKVEFTGLIKLSCKAKAFLKSINPDAVTNLLQLVDTFESEGLVVQYHDVDGDWTEFNSNLDIAHFVLGTKSETLYRLYPLVKRSKIGEQVTFTVKQWRDESDRLIDKIKQRFNHQSLVVRSSSFAEDCWDESHAGGFESVLNVACKDGAIIDAVNTVVESYQHSNTIENDQVLVQACLSGVQMSGVIFTRTLETGAPYYRLNFDDQTQSTESVTSGAGKDLRTVVVSKANALNCDHLDENIQKVLKGVVEIEDLLGYDKLDIEFAIDGMGELHIFQVRPIAVSYKNDEIADSEVYETLNECVKSFECDQYKGPGIVGQSASFGVMPDWNPAEIIGVKPKQLAYSLYRHLIVDQIWADQRAAYGYRDVSQYPLIRVFAGQPYVNIRNSLNSFIPQSVSEAAAERICQAYLALLKDKPHFHDKIEFDVAFTVLSPNFQASAKKRLSAYGVLDKDIKELEAGLRSLTQEAFHRLGSDTESLKQLAESRNVILNSDISELNKALLLLDECKKYGTLAFAHAARAGFVAMTFLNGLVSSGILTSDEKNQFLSSFKTVAGEFESDAAAVSEGKMSKASYVNEYGHLRPGTYDITAKAYWEKPEQYLFSKITDDHTSTHETVGFELNAEQKKAIDQWISGMQLTLSADELMAYCRSATQARERVKFEFSKNLSKALDMIVAFGKAHDINRKKMAYLSLENLKEFQLGVKNVSTLKKTIKANKKQYKMAKMIELPQLITEASDFFAFERNAAEPNFITNKSIENESTLLTNDPKDLVGKIVLIEQADPGYDWMFAHDLAGLITQYGGANSHMAIRSAELGLPAAIGVGDKIYDELKHASVLRLNCAQKQIIRVK